METLRIQTSAEECAELFKKARVLSLREGSRSEQIESEKQFLETQHARFNLWADNIGVFALGNGSLDARLYEYEDITTLVLGQLESLQYQLCRVATYRLVDSGAQGAAQACDDEYMSTAASDSTFSSMITDAEDLEANDREGVADAEDEEPPLVAIARAVHRLHRVAMAIRRSGATSHDAKAATVRFFEDGMDLVEVFRTYCLERLLRRFPTAAQYTVERIAYTSAERRRRFLYCNKHKQKLEGRRRSSQMHQTILESGKVRAEDLKETGAQETQKLPRQAGSHNAALGSVAQFSQTTASKVIRNKFQYDGTTPTTIASVAPSTQLLVDNSIYPPAPKVPPGTAEFYCPYCCKVHPATERSGRRWKHHFLQDLSPFICLVEDCHDPYKLYPDQSSWLKHMESHSVKYTCQQHPEPLDFGSAAEFDNHIIHEHKRLHPARLERLRCFNSSTSKLNIYNCPICGFKPTKIPTPGQSASSHEPAYKELVAHIADDLLFISMWSLHDVDEPDRNISSNGSDLRIAEESTQGTDFPSTNPSVGIRKDRKEDWDYHTWVHTATETENLPPDFIPEWADPEYEWLQVFEKRRPTYEGHEQDVKLENFVRRLQLEKLMDDGKTADPQLPCHLLPSNPKSNKDFYGREGAIERLETALHPARATKSLQTMALTGPAGIGKTTLAMQYCVNYKNQYDVVLWVHADEESKLANDFTRIAVELGFVGRYSAETRDQAHCRQMVKAWLTNPLRSLNEPDTSEKASWLLVFDHVVDPKIVNLYWPISAQSGSILITGRKAMPWAVTKYPSLPVEPFNSEDSAAFLARLLKHDNVRNGQLKLGLSASHSPYQLVFLARMIDLGQYSLEKFIQASKDDDGKQVILSLHSEEATKNETEFSQWALESLSEKAAALLDVMSMLDPDEIVEQMLMLPPDNISIKGYPRTKEEYYEARNELLRFSFISRNRTPGTLTIHRPIQDAACKNMSKESFRNVFHTCVALINDQWPYQAFTWRHGIHRWPRCEELYPHIVRLNRYFAPRVPFHWIDIDGAYGYGRLATDLVWYCHERGRLAESEGFFNKALSCCAAVRASLKLNPGLSKSLNLAQVDRTLAEIHHNYGCVTAEMNRPDEALKHQLIFNNMMQEELGQSPGTDMRLALSFNELGVAYMINDQVDQGEACFKRSVREMERLKDFKKYKISLPLVNWAACCAMSGRHDEAETMLLRGLLDRVEKFGENDRESFITGRFYHHLANVKLLQGFEEESYEYLERARDHYRKTLGRGHHRSADIAVALGQHYSRRGDDNMAVEFYTKALEAYENRSIYNPEMLRAFFKRAESLRRLERYADADADLSVCWGLYNTVRPNHGKPLSDLTNEDLDSFIVFWSR